MPAFGVNWIRLLKAPVSARVGGRRTPVSSAMLAGIRSVVFGSRRSAPGDWDHEERAVARKSGNAILSVNRDQESVAGRAALPRRPDRRNWAARQPSPTRLVGVAASRN